MLNIVLIVAAAVAALVLPTVVAVKQRRSGKTVKQALLGHVCTFFGVLVICAAFPLSINAYAEEAAPAASTTEEAAESSAEGLKYLAAALAVGLGSIGGGLAVAAAAPAAIGAVSEDPKSFSKALIFVALGEGCALYGFVVALLMLFI